MDPREQELSELRREVEELRHRVERLEDARPTATAKPAPVAPPQPVPVQPRPQPPTALPIPRKARRSPASAEELEARIGTHWLNRVGIIAVLVGVSYFLKYAFDNGWIGPSGRIAIGLLAGIAVTVWSETFRRKGYALFSYGLKAIGIGTLYLSLWAAVQVYHLISPGVGFVAMAIVTASTVVMALTQNAQLLAAYALAGGFSTPALCSTGQNHEIFLFSYTTLLAAGAVTLTALRGWRRLAVGAFFGTLFMYIAWSATYYNINEFGVTSFFATLFFLIFAAGALVPRVKEPVDATFLAAMLALANASAYFLEMYDLFGNAHPNTFRDNASAWLAIGLAAFYVLLAQQVAKQAAGAENRRLLNLVHLALAIGFVTTAIPLKLNGHWITMGWLVESAALLYVAQRLRHEFLKIFGIVALLFGLFRLLVEGWQRQPFLFLNWRFATFLVAIAVLGAVAYGAQKSERSDERSGGLAAGVMLNGFALIALFHEVQDFFQPEINEKWTEHSYAAARSVETIRSFSHSAVWMLYGATLMFIGFRRGSAFLRWQAIVLLGITIIKVFLFDTSMLDLGFRILSFIGLGVVLLGVSFLYQKGHISLPGRGE
ncbi:DUF2339 domain-containing protein [Candidatus Korobacter versatilis]|uniref:DUF2339 domain-containing protein n=1 Tax=Candidatus Korobacter versatilis TaxID=658062 RepID=UPI0005A4AB54|nr:DUF2339 domain-containing protein [Candidatus Koribacter versatilis]